MRFRIREERLIIRRINKSTTAVRKRCKIEIRWRWGKRNAKWGKSEGSK